jgi:pentatricopeptide repeat protein
MESRELSPLEYNALLKSLSKSGDLISAANYFNEMKRGNIEIKYPTLFHLIESSCHAGEISQMMNYFQELKSRNCKITMFLYKTMTAACLSNNDIPQAFAILDNFFDELDAEQGKLVLIMFLRHFIKTNSVSSMENIFQKFKATGKFTMNSKVYSLMSQAHSKVGNLAMMEKYLDEMKKCGVDRLFNGRFVLRAYANYGTLEDVEKACHKLRIDFDVSDEMLNHLLKIEGLKKSES